MAEDRHYPDIGAYTHMVMLNLRSMFSFYTKLPEDHLFVKLGVEAALKHACYCAADMTVESNYGAAYTQQQDFMESYGREAFALYKNYMLEKVAQSNGMDKIKPDDWLELKTSLEKISSTTFKKASKLADGVRSGKTEPYIHSDSNQPDIKELMKSPKPQWTINVSDLQAGKIAYQTNTLKP